MATARRVRERDSGLTLTASLLALAAVAWALSAERMSGMDMGPGTELGGLGGFVVTWVLMMAAMMLPSLAPAARASGRAAAFVAGYLGVWSGAGVAAYAVVEGVRLQDLGWLAWDRAGRYVAAGVILAAAAYQLTPAKAGCLRRCRHPAVSGPGLASALRDGVRHGGFCVGCCWALMAALFALGAMSLVWMALIGALITAERLLPQRAMAVTGVAVVLAALALGVALSPGDVPGLTVPSS
jgi:predicted metal-binding membrane protein